MTYEEEAIALYDQVLTFSARVEIYSSETVALLKGRLVKAGLEPQQQAALFLFIDTMRAD